LRGATQIVTVGETFNNRLESFVLTGYGLDSINFDNRCAKFIGLASTGFRIAGQLLQPRGRFGPPAENLLVLAQNATNGFAGETVDRVALCRLRSKTQLVALSVNCDEVLAELAEGADGRSDSADDDLGTSFARHGPRHDELAVFDDPAEGINRRGDFGRIDSPPSVNLGATGVVTNDTGIRAFSEQ
jgi:hypothetical protein